MLNEKALIRKMKADYKGAGYRVGAVFQDGIEWLVVGGMSWMAAGPLADISRELKAQVLLHTGALPGTPVKVQQDEGVQTEITGELEKAFTALFSGANGWMHCQGTGLWCASHRVWQAADGRCILFDPLETALVRQDEQEELVSVTDGKRLILDSGTGRAWMLTSETGNTWRDILEYLSHCDIASGMPFDGTDGQMALGEDEQA